VGEYVLFSAMREPLSYYLLLYCLPPLSPHSKGYLIQKHILSYGGWYVATTVLFYIIYFSMLFIHSFSRERIQYNIKEHKYF
jgi:hypothetical protein